jgi:hypothetical protein
MGHFSKVSTIVNWNSFEMLTEINVYFNIPTKFGLNERRGESQTLIYFIVVVTCY